jgi:hypothetical protein
MFGHFSATGEKTMGVTAALKPRARRGNAGMAPSRLDLPEALCRWGVDLLSGGTLQQLLRQLLIVNEEARGGERGNILDLITQLEAMQYEELDLYRALEEAYWWLK